MESFVQNLLALSNSHIWLVVAFLVFAVCAVMTLVMFWQFQQHHQTIEETNPEQDAILLDISDCSQNKKYRVTAKPMMIGRISAHDSANYDSLVIPEVTVGRSHSVIERRGREFWLQDQGSVNGSYINGERIEGEAKLSSGDYVRIHKFTFQFLIPKPAELEKMMKESASDQWSAGRQQVAKTMGAASAVMSQELSSTPARKAPAKPEAQPIERTEVLNRDEIQAQLQPHEPEASQNDPSVEEADAFIAQVQVESEGDKTARLYSEQLDSPPEQQPEYRIPAQEVAKADNQKSTMQPIENMDEKVQEALSDFFSDNASDDDEAEDEALEFTEAGEKLASLGLFSEQNEEDEAAVETDDHPMKLALDMSSDDISLNEFIDNTEMGTEKRGNLSGVNKPV